MGNGKGEDLKRILALLIVKVGVRKRDDNGKDRTRDVLDDGTPDDGNLPVLAGGYDAVEIATELVALFTQLEDIIER